MIKKITSDELINIRRTKEHLTVVDVIGIGSYEKKNNSRGDRDPPGGIGRESR